MRDHDYTPLFKAEHMLKDVRLALEEAQAAGDPVSRRCGWPATPSSRRWARPRLMTTSAPCVEAFEGLAATGIS